MESIAQLLQSGVEWLGIPQDITPWELLNSELITATIIGAVGLFLNRKVNRLSEKAEDTATLAAYERELEDFTEAERAPMIRIAEPRADLSDVMHDVEELVPGAPPSAAAEVGMAAPPGGDTGESGNPLQSEASHVVNAAKKFVDGRLDSQHDGRKRRKYANIGKRDYRVRVLAARDDGLITGTQALNLLGVFETWRPYGTGRKIVTEDIISKMKRLLSEAEREKVIVRNGSRRSQRRQARAEAEMH